MAKKAFVDYDVVEDILSVNIKEKASDSIEFDRFVIDYSKEGRIVGVEIFKASQFVKDFGILSKEFLMQAKEANFSVIQGKEYALIKIQLLSKLGEQKEIVVPTPVPQMVRV